MSPSLSGDFGSKNDVSAGANFCCSVALLSLIAKNMALQAYSDFLGTHRSIFNINTAHFCEGNGLTTSISTFFANITALFET
jgi:hypothetical protein